MQFSYSAYKVNGILGRKGEHIRIYLDGGTTPALDVPLENLLRGKFDGFPRPLVGEKSGSFFFYVPIRYRKSCKVEVEGTKKPILARHKSRLIARGRKNCWPQISRTRFL